MSYRMPNILSFQILEVTLKLIISKLALLILLTRLAPRGGVKILNLLLGISYNMLKDYVPNLRVVALQLRISASGRDRGNDTCNPLGMALQASQKFWWQISIYCMYMLNFISST